MPLPDKERLREFVDGTQGLYFQAEVQALAQYVEKAQTLPDKWRKEEPHIWPQVHADELDELSNRSE